MPMPAADWQKTKDALFLLSNVEQQLNNLQSRLPRAGKALSAVASAEKDAARKSNLKKAVETMSVANKQVKTGLSAVKAVYAASDPKVLPKYSAVGDFKKVTTKPIAALKAVAASADSILLQMEAGRDPGGPTVLPGTQNPDIKASVEALKFLQKAMNEFRVKLAQVH